MKYILDTHIFIWVLSDLSKLSANQLAVMNNKKHEFFISPATMWEMAIKVRIGKLALSSPFDKMIDKERKRAKIKVLPISLAHYQLISTLDAPKDHQDPFDHLIISQAISENMGIITQDGKFPYYIWQGLNIIS